MDFVDRIDEMARLKEAFAREKAALVVVYGRRRLGKSTLIKKVLLDKDVYFPVGDVEALREKLQANMDNPYHREQYDMAQYDWDIIAGQVAEVYHQLLEK